MKPSEDWTRMEDVTKAIDELLAKNGGNLDQIKPYAVAQQMGAHANGCLYEKVHADIRRRRTVPQLPVGPVPTELLTAVDAAFEQAREEVKSEVARRFAEHTTRVSQEAARRSALDAELVADGERGYNELLKLCEQTEQKLDAAQLRLTELEKQLSGLSSENTWLLGQVAGLTALANPFLNREQPDRHPPGHDDAISSPD